MREREGLRRGRRRGVGGRGERGSLRRRRGGRRRPTRIQETHRASSAHLAAHLRITTQAPVLETVRLSEDVVFSQENRRLARVPLARLRETTHDARVPQRRTEVAHLAKERLHRLLPRRLHVVEHRVVSSSASLSRRAGAASVVRAVPNSRTGRPVPIATSNARLLPHTHLGPPLFCRSPLALSGPRVEPSLHPSGAAPQKPTRGATIGTARLSSRRVLRPRDVTSPPCFAPRLARRRARKASAPSTPMRLAAARGGHDRDPRQARGSHAEEAQARR